MVYRKWCITMAFIFYVNVLLIWIKCQHMCFYSVLIQCLSGLGWIWVARGSLSSTLWASSHTLLWGTACPRGDPHWTLLQSWWDHISQLHTVLQKVEQTHPVSEGVCLDAHAFYFSNWIICYHATLQLKPSNLNIYTIVQKFGVGNHFFFFFSFF